VSAYSKSIIGLTADCHRTRLPSAARHDAARRMTAWPTTPQAIKARISSYRRILRQEAASPGGFGDGRGKRFLLFTLYFQLREDDEARAYIDWYRATFPEDHGHAESFLCWALILRRLGREDEAVYRFIQAIDDNLPVVADVVGDLQAPYGIWGEDMWQVYRVDASVIDAMTAEEHAWLRSTWRLPAVVAMRERYIAIGRALVTEPVGAHRSALVREQSALARAFMPQEMPPLAKGTDWLTGGRVATKRGSRKVIRTTPETWRRGGR
jgi:hypothetical protein